MKRTKSGLILPDAPEKLNKTIDDFDLIDPMEMQSMIVVPLEQALKQGISPEQPTTIPVNVLCGLIKTIRSMSQALTEIQDMGQSLLLDDSVDKSHKDKMRKILGFPAEIDVSDIFKQVEKGQVTENNKE